MNKLAQTEGDRGAAVAMFPSAPPQQPGGQSLMVAVMCTRACVFFFASHCNVIIHPFTALGKPRCVEFV